MSSGLDAPTQRRWIASKVVFVCGLTLFVGILLGLAAFAIMIWSLEGFGVGLVSAFGIQAEERPVWTYPLLALVGFVILPVALFMPILVPLALNWKNPRRIVVFRRFNTRYENKALRKIASEHLSPFGHVFTLADSQIHRSMFVRIPMVLGQLNLLNFRLRRIHDDSGVSDFKKTLERTWRLNLNWLLSPRKIFPIQTSDEYWQTCVGLLLDKADIVVMDVSIFSTSMAWEIGQCERRNLMSKLVLVTRREKIEAGAAQLNELENEIGARTDAPFAYGAKGLERPTELRERVAKILSAAESGFVPARNSGVQVLWTFVWNLALSFALAGGGFLATAPTLSPEWTAHHSPFKTQVMTAYYENSNLTYLDRLVKEDWDWTHKELRQSARNGLGLRKTNAIKAIGQLGDEGDIPLLLDLIAQHSKVVKDSERMHGLLRWGYLEESALTALMKRLGKPALPALLSAINALPYLPFDLDLDGDLFDDYIAPNVAVDDNAVVAKLLSCRNQTGRFIAALLLAPRGDARTGPILREMIEVSTPSLFADYAQMWLSRLALGSSGRIKQRG
jgi:hypothetical protein